MCALGSSKLSHLFIASAFGSAVLWAVPAVSAADVKTYQVDTEASRVYVKVGSASLLGHQHGVEGNLKSGKIVLGGTSELVFDMATFDADTTEARQRTKVKGKATKSEAKKVTAAMRGAEVLNVDQFPTATYRISSIVPADKQSAGEPGNYELKGSFTLHGTEQALKFNARLERTDTPGRFKMTGSFSIKQTDYGITPYSAVGGLAKVANELEITGDLILKSAK